MRMMGRPVGGWWVVSAALVLGCKDTASLGDYDEGPTSSGAASTTGSPTSTSASSSEGSTTGVGSSSSTSDAGADESSSSTGGGFISWPDGGSTGCAAMSWCDIWAQDCREDGFKCVPWSADGDDEIEGCVTSRCVEIDSDPVPVGGVCTVVEQAWTGFDDCGPDSFCWDVDPATLQGTCVALCGGTQADPECTGGLECFVAFREWLTACVPSCEPLGAACAAGSTCVVADGEASVCVPESFGIPSTAGEGCYDMGCAHGLACVDADALPECDYGRCCAPLCDPAASDCAEPQPTCTPLEGTPGVGACTTEP
jgi:hypothetical protein